MAKTALNTIKSWFKTGLKPTETQFANTFDSFHHKDESIPQTSIANLQESFDEKVDKEALSNLPTIISINGNPFTLIKNPVNNNPEMASTLEKNDFAAVGAWNATEFWDKAIFLGGNKDDKLNWKVLSSTKEIPHT